MLAKLLRFIGLMIIIVGIIIIVSPYIREDIKKSQDEKVISEFDRRFAADSLITENDVDSSMASDSVRQEIIKYNNNLKDEKYPHISDAWDYENIAGLEGLFEDDLFGYIDIPAMKCTLPLYLGASYDHMDKGAALLGGTSVPSGCPDTNSVIAAHRGWNKGPYFLDIEKLKKGDSVSITSMYGKLTYHVWGIDIIEPDDFNRLGIYPGKEMITLLTCHPYMSHGRYRYIVYCIGSSHDDEEESMVTDLRCGMRNNGFIISSGGEVYKTSEPDIRNEKTIRLLLAVCMLIMAAVTILTGVIGKIIKKWRSEK